ncbi:winged helix-turn-helix domain-containing tetratricopeptide repeat protein [Pseudorhizobium flavum]|uniref:TolB-like protein/DNA-binding winged helix-turn-helix (WHTH) protein/predicted TPR repeat methyltransferase n=1 Tax=Pseudorhizobium flavum TaxID=1335061 RepID=A0A7W9Z4H6_9HYPH|nr:winged helix-turn-helix domain-containing protein [Pseudorhizobium flavum]MBB6182336.1 TolB-like protein/DNA-binding winged helix-turn-helix (wHTH) protein/predicted TPR repeat methyltransferase [Pseudorhizobium flavum]CAD6632073.1 adenylate/guanylate cyclase domain-containing protein [Pseudorhizobium flavum]
MTTPKRYRFGSFVLDLERMALIDDGTQIELRPKAFDTLRVLVERAGCLVTKDELVAAVWPDVIVNDDALAQCVRDVRKALRDTEQRIIETVPRRGYLFAAKIEDGSGSSDPQSAPITTGDHRRLTFVAALTAVVALLVTLGWYGFARKAETTIAQDRRPSIAVLPFRASTESDADAWLGEGVADDIIMALSRFRDIAVISRNSSFRFNDGEDLATIRDRVKADFLLQGSLRRTGDKLRLAVQLVDLETGVNRWAERFDRPWSHVFDIQEAVARDVAAQLATQARDAAVVRSQGMPPAVLDAYDLVLRGRKAYLSFSRPGALEGLDLVRRAVAVDPSYAVAWELLAQLLIQFFIQPYDERQGDPVVMAEARAALTKAVQLDPYYSTARAGLGAIIAREGDFDTSLKELREALRLNPNDASTLKVHADILSRAGHHEESLTTWNEVARLDPVGTPLDAALKSRAEFFMGYNEAALASARRCAALAPRLQPCLLYLTIAASAAGQPEEAKAAAQRLLELNPDISIARHFAIIPFRNPTDVEKMASYLRAAGLPE